MILQESLRDLQAQTRTKPSSTAQSWLRGLIFEKEKMTFLRVLIHHHHTPVIKAQENQEEGEALQREQGMETKQKKGELGQELPAEEQPLIHVTVMDLRTIQRSLQWLLKIGQKRSPPRDTLLQGGLNTNLEYQNRAFLPLQPFLQHSQHSASQAWSQEVAMMAYLRNLRNR